MLSARLDRQISDLILVSANLTSLLGKPPDDAIFMSSSGNTAFIVLHVFFHYIFTLMFSPLLLAQHCTRIFCGKFENRCLPDMLVAVKKWE